MFSVYLFAALAVANFGAAIYEYYNGEEFLPGLIMGVVMIHAAQLELIGKKLKELKNGN